MKYAVGDRVIVRKDLKRGREYAMEDSGIVDDAMPTMVDMAGQTVTISDTFSKYKVAEDRACFNWTDGMFEGFADITDEEINMDALSDEFTKLML